jgi:glucosamine--fructose-6-phosphate aminotransferase (isomerizing)
MYEQPQVLGRLARHVEHFAGQVGLLAAEQGGFRDVVVLAPAPSQPVALLGRHAAALRQGVPARGLDRRLVIAICASGDDDRVLELAHRALNSGSPVVAVTNDARSSLARAATLSVDVAAGLELSNAATKSATGMMLAVLALVEGLPELRAGGAGQVADAASTENAGILDGPRIADSARAGALAEAVGALLADREPADAAAARLVHARRVAVVGQGHHHPAALETARMLRETAGLMVEGFSVEGFCSGPMGGFDADTAVVLLAGRGHTAVRSLGARLRARGARVIVLGDDPNRPDDLLFPSVGALGTVSASAECILATVRGQQLGLAALRALGVDPDRPAGQAFSPNAAVTVNAATATANAVQQSPQYSTAARITPS